MERRFYLMLVFLCHGGESLAQLVFNVTLNAQELSGMTNGLNVILSSTVKIYCDGQNSYSVYNLQEEDFNTCVKDSSAIVIGSCVNSPLTIDIKTLAIQFDDEVSYEVGNTYYYGVFDGGSGQPCLNGLKFEVNVVSSLEMEAVSSTVIVAETTSTSQSSSFKYDSSSVAVLAPPGTTTASTFVVGLTATKSTSAMSGGQYIYSYTSAEAHVSSSTSSQTIMPTIDAAESLSQSTLFGGIIGSVVGIIVIIAAAIICILLLYYRKKVSTRCIANNSEVEYEKSDKIQETINIPEYDPQEKNEFNKVENHNNTSPFYANLDVNSSLTPLLGAGSMSPPPTPSNLPPIYENSKMEITKPEDLTNTEDTNGLGIDDSCTNDNADSNSEKSNNVLFSDKSHINSVLTCESPPPYLNSSMESSIL